MIELEEDVGIKIPDDDYGNMRTVDDLLRYLNRRNVNLPPHDTGLGT